MSQNPFATPAAATGGVDLKTLVGALLIIEPHSVEEGIQTVHGPSSAIRATIHVVDGPSAGDVHEDALLFPKVLQGQLRTRVGQKVLGRLGQGVAKPGQSAPWVIQEAQPADVQAGTDYLNRQQSGQFAAAAPTGSNPPF